MRSSEIIFVLRDGLSEGQFAMAVDEELKAIKRGSAEFDSEYHPKFVFVIGTKRHFKKFFTFHEGIFQNLAPGSSHYPLKGVGAVELALLFSSDRQFCYIAAGAIYQADELAKRGQNNYLAMKRLEGTEFRVIGPLGGLSCSD
uniref:Piwi domain-containing protein n=1 Tax=Ditylenchus dipsaci TaxID=166011 RepID=A0A915DKG8_9BILA